MGKPSDLSQSDNGGVGAPPNPSDPSSGTQCSCFRKLVGFKCFLVLLLGVSVFLPALFFLPPFSNLSDPDDSDLDPRFRGHAIVATFKLRKPITMLQDNVLQLESDISGELNILDSKVVVLYLDVSSKPNVTNVYFGVDPETKDSPLTSAAQSLIRSSFVSLVINQTSLRLTTSFFGEPFLFEVLKFPGGITIAPPQKAFLLQQIQVQFNFTLNFSIYQTQGAFDELRIQLKSGLRLKPSENLYISLTNSRGSTMMPPVTVQTSVVLAVGINSSLPRLKQLAQTITGSHSRNLGLNHTVFGKVKQVSLSSILQHSLSSGAPVPAPSAYPHSYHHHHHHHHQDHDFYPGPVSAPSSSPVKRRPIPIKRPPSPAPAPIKSYRSKPPGCRYEFGKRHRWNAPKQYEFGKRHRWNAPKQYFHPPAIAPKISSKHHYAALLPSPAVSPAPVSSGYSPSTPLHHAILAHRNAPAYETDLEPPDRMTLMAPAPAPCQSYECSRPMMKRTAAVFCVWKEQSSL